MTTHARKRRPAFDREAGVTIAQKLFHERGYDAVSVADLTEALEINPPSLYAAYGSKAKLFERALRRYTSENALPLAEIFAEGRSPVEALTELLMIATRQYTDDAQRRGCMVTEGMRADDEIAREMASRLAQPGHDAIRTYIAACGAKDPDRAADFVLVTLRGLSSFACLGYDQDRLLECARMASRALEQEFKD
jgi:TetR/AcrR family transcriptional regulator, repressor for divergent bdcA